MRSGSFASRGGHLPKSPASRRQAARRRLTALYAMLGLALLAGLIGSLSTSRSELMAKPAMGPFSYFPHE